MYKNYIFDLYGTLVDINTNEKKKYLWEKMADFYGFYGAIYTAKELKSEYERLCISYDDKITDVLYSEIEIEDVFHELFIQKGVEAYEELAIHAGQMFRILSTKYLKLYEGVIDLLETLKKKNKRIYLLSNAQEIFTLPEMEYLGIIDYFDGIIISSTEQCRKPDTTFYNVLFNKFLIQKCESIMIGNDFINDIKGAYDAGLDSLYIHSNLSPEITDKLYSNYTIMDGNVKKIKDLIIK